MHLWGTASVLDLAENNFTRIRQDDLPMHVVPLPVYPGLHVQL